MSYIGARPAEQILSSADIQDGAISTVDLANASITQAKLASGVAGSGPAFCVYRSGSTQSISQNTWTKVQFQTEEFDTSSAYDNATNYRFTPLVAGYYQVNLSIGLSYNTLPPSTIYISLYKNGSSYRTGRIISSSPYGTIALSDVVYFNGSTDYIEGYAYSNSASAVVLYQTNNIAAPFCTFFSATLVRSA